jgi:hypothetical protein
MDGKEAELDGAVWGWDGIKIITTSSAQPSASCIILTGTCLLKGS